MANGLTGIILSIQFEKFKIWSDRKMLKSVSSVIPHDYEMKEKSVGFSTFTAFSGTPVEDQLKNESENLERRMASGLSRGLKSSYWSSIDTQSFRVSDLTIRSYLASPEGRRIGEIPDGKVRQYFSGVLGGGEVFLRFFEMDIEDYVEYKRNKNPASTKNMIRMKSFDTQSIISAIDRSEKRSANLQGFLKSEIENAGLGTLVGTGVEKWFRSLTSDSSTGGLLIRTRDEAGETPIFCPECVDECEVRFLHLGARKITLPPIPNSILDLQILCTENIHKSHSLDDCLGLSEVEEILNKSRLEMGLNNHETMFLEISREDIADKYGDWAWLQIEGGDETSIISQYFTHDS